MSRHDVRLPDCSYHTEGGGSGWMLDETYTQCRKCYYWFSPKDVTLNKKEPTNDSSSS